MGQIATNALCTRFNSIIELEYIPKQFKEDIIVPIPKSGGKDTTKKDNYRAITLLSCMHKLFEKNCYTGSQLMRSDITHAICVSKKML